MSKRRALVTGGNRGIGLATVEAFHAAGHEVVLGSRDVEGGRAVAPDGVDVVRLDVTDTDSIADVVKAMGEQGVDILVNNAGVYPQGSLLEENGAFANTLDINLHGPLRLAQAFMPGMNARGWGRVLNVTSGYGSIASGTLSGPPIYSVSKAALNALTMALAREAAGDVSVIAVDPGWVRTRMGGPNASLAPESPASKMLELAERPASETNGKVI